MGRLFCILIVCALTRWLYATDEKHIMSPGSALIVATLQMKHQPVLAVPQWKIYALVWILCCKRDKLLTLALKHYVVDKLTLLLTNIMLTLYFQAFVTTLMN